MQDTASRPAASIVDAGRGVRVERSDGTSFVLDAALVWRECRSAAGTIRRLEGRAWPPADLKIVGLAHVGHYAVNLAFSDGHDRGIYPWSFLEGLATKRSADDFLTPPLAPICGHPQI